LAGDKSSLVGKDREASRQAGHGVDAVRVVEETIIRENIGLGPLPLRGHALVGFDQDVDVALLQALGAASCAAEQTSRSASGKCEDAEEAHVVEVNVWIGGSAVENKTDWRC